jgi:hypothetical protein
LYSIFITHHQKTAILNRFIENADCDQNIYFSICGIFHTSPTPYSRIVLEDMIVAQLVNIFPAYGALSFIAVFIRNFRYRAYLNLNEFNTFHTLTGPLGNVVD